ncbi:MAG: PQQ-binding-like beta-propeller repeat protein [Polyangiaceae bacterium]|nr:PQQ-binding-like beta-propeller repeat protein [Polyangiaceae bacterium]
MLRRSMVGSFLMVSCAGGAPPPAEPGSPPAPGAIVAEPTEPPPAATIVAAPSAQTPTPPVEPEPAVAVDVPSAAGWATFHGDNARTGASSAPEIRQPRIVWKAEVGVFSWLNSPLALGKTLVIAPSSGSAHNKPDPKDGVSAYHLGTGKRAWFTHFDQDANGVAANQTHVFATSDDEHVYALELKSGKVSWKAKGAGKMYSHPLIVRDRVVVGDASGYVYAFAVSDGKPLWKVQLTGAIRGGASSDGTSVYVASQGGEVAALSLEGKPLWKKIVKRAAWNNQGPDEAIVAYSPPVVGKDALYLTFGRDTYYTGQPGVLALDKKTGAVKWKGKGPGDWGNVRSTPVLVQDRLVYGEPYSGDVAGLDAKTGRTRYRDTIGGCFFPQWSSPGAAGDLVYLPRYDGSVYALRATSGKVEWEIFLGDSKRAGRDQPAKSKTCGWENPDGAIYAPAAIAEDGTLLVGTAEGVLYAIGK